ncbi:stabilizer of axonemal microtubules 1 [Dendropsophus ebraccatus]|uniref:stabilizer of axonemal microtubules 1 n=1 Tax=Dendropsophus ebraccatus TaxID=150705 RepID=UPI0038313BD6
MADRDRHESDDYKLWNFSKRESIRPINAYYPPKEKFDINSTFQDHFQFWPTRPTQSYKPVHLYSGCLEPMNYITNYNIEYVPHQIEKRVHKKENYRPSKDTFNCLATQRQDHKGLPEKAAKSLKPRYSLAGRAFICLSEFQDKYQMWPLPPSFEKKSVPYQKPTDKMDVISTTQFDYTPHIPQRQASYKPVQQYQKGSKAFEASSTMKEDFKPWQCKKVSPIWQQSNLQLPIDSFETTTTTRHDYVLHPLMHTASFRPVNKASMSLMPIDSQTTYSTSYTVKPFPTCSTAHKDLPKYLYLGTDSLGRMPYKLQCEKETKPDISHTAAVPLSPECPQWENKVMSLNETETVA